MCIARRLKFFVRPLVCILSQIKLLFGPLVIQLVWYILKQLFTSVSAKVSRLGKYPPLFTSTSVNNCQIFRSISTREGRASLPCRRSFGSSWNLSSPTNVCCPSEKKRRPITADFQIWEVHFGLGVFSRECTSNNHGDSWCGLSTSVSNFFFGIGVFDSRKKKS